MDALLIFVSLLVPCITFYNEHHYNAQYNHYKMRNRLTTLPIRERALMRAKYQYIHPYTSRYSRYLRAKVATVVPASPNLNMSFFSPIVNMQYQATEINETKYPWIASVYHTSNSTRPYLCTAACIEERIFMTAARCIAQGKIIYMNVRYQGEVLRPIALVIPTNRTKQMFDEIGLIVVNETYQGTWDTVPLYTASRSGDNFKWFNTYHMYEGTAIGYIAAVAPEVEVGSPQLQALYEVHVYVSNFFCQEYYNKQDNSSYFVPCYHTCTLEENAANDEKCQKYLAGEGHMVLTNNTKKIIGVATWADSSDKYYPIGMSVPNSASFFEDLKCAKSIKNASTSDTKFAYLCESKTQRR